jgi:hypothetical protein
MTRSTIVTLLIGLVGGALLTSALTTAGRGFLASAGSDHGAQQSAGARHRSRWHPIAPTRFRDRGGLDDANLP